jgi:hypothetical protein
MYYVGAAFSTFTGRHTHCVAAGGEEKWGRLVVTWEGVDWRLQELVRRTVKQLLTSAILCPEMPVGEAPRQQQAR